MVETIEVDGLEIAVDRAKLEDWHALSIIRRIHKADQFGQADLIFELIGYVTDQTEETIVAHLGGDSVSAQAVVDFIGKVFEAAAPKN